jgi:hypothetical protein
LISKSEGPASSGEEMRSFVMEGIVISSSIDDNVLETVDNSQEAGDVRPLRNSTK